MRTSLLFFTAYYSLFFVLHFVGLFFFNISLQQALFFEIHGSIFVITALLLFGLLRAFNGYSHYVAWLYLLGSAVKFGLFILLLWPLFKADCEVTILEKSSFLIPYCSSLFLETRILISKLNKI